MKCPVNRLIVQIDQKYTDKIGLLYIDTNYQPEQHVTTMGRVVSVPARVSAEFEYAGIVPEVQRGDEICFSYQVVNNRDPDGSHSNLFIHNEKEYWLVDYFQVFFAVRQIANREPQIIPIGSHVLIEPIKEDAYVGFLIVPESMKSQTVKGKGVLKYIGTPQSNLGQIDCMEGDIVYYRQETAPEYDTLGKKYIIIKQKAILAKEN